MPCKNSKVGDFRQQSWSHGISNIPGELQLPSSASSRRLKMRSQPFKATDHSTRRFEKTTASWGMCYVSKWMLGSCRMLRPAKSSVTFSSNLLLFISVLVSLVTECNPVICQVYIRVNGVIHCEKSASVCSPECIPYEVLAREGVQTRNSVLGAFSKSDVYYEYMSFSF